MQAPSERELSVRKTHREPQASATLPTGELRALIKPQGRQRRMQTPKSDTSAPDGAAVVRGDHSEDLGDKLLRTVLSDPGSSPVVWGKHCDHEQPQRPGFVFQTQTGRVAAVPTTLLKCPFVDGFGPTRSCYRLIYKHF